MPTYKHDPSDKLDYTWDFDEDGWLASTETISSYTFAADAGLVLYDDSKHASAVTGRANTAVTTWIRVSGATVGQRLGVTCHIVTSAGREVDKTLYFLILQR